MRSAGFGRLADIIAGIAGALAAGLLVPQGGFMGGGFSGAVVAATLGAVAPLLLLRLFRRAWAKNSQPVWAWNSGPSAIPEESPCCENLDESSSSSRYCLLNLQ